MNNDAAMQGKQSADAVNSSEATSNTGNSTPLGRRSFLAAAASTVVSAAAFGRDFGPGAPPTRYPDPDIVELDKRFAKYKLGNTPIQRLHTGTLWAEGPAWNGVGRYLLWSDIPNNLQMRWLEENGKTSVFRRPSGNSNGNTFDYQGRQISCEHGNRRVVRYEYNGKIT
ncbi:MAG: SMP-30/gluconolactonase/LRE family protein, partial [Planctomycetales bacterium]